MPNQLTIEVYIKRSDIESILSDDAVTQLLVQGSINISGNITCEWNVKAVGYPTAQAMSKSTCPQPCPQ